MLGIVLIYFIGKRFYELAERYQKSQWGFAILGVASYYVGTFIGGIAIAIGAELLGTTPIEEMNELTLSLLAFPFGLLAGVVTYQLLKSVWTRKRTAHDQADVLDEMFTVNH
jgi:cytosine/uracil/thiamine/allantoin permease